MRAIIAPMIATEVPTYVYRGLPKKSIDPLPAVHRGPVFHYTNAVATKSILETGELRASDVESCNDPSERKYGWEAIRESYHDTRKRFSRRSRYNLDQAVETSLDADSGAHHPYIISASTRENDLNQYRLYGQYQLGLNSKHSWWQMPKQGWTRWSPSNPEHLDDISNLGLLGSWRPVVYGDRQAEGMVRPALEVCAQMINRAPTQDPEDESLAANFLLEVVALHIKHEAYADEEEVRLLFQDGPMTDGDPQAFANGDRMRLYLKVRPLEGLPIDSIYLGPQAKSRAAVTALKHLCGRVDNSASRAMPNRSGIRIEQSDLPYTG